MSAVRNPDETRNRLLEAAFDEIYENGFQGMRVDDILKRTGLKKGALYHHFNSKSEIAYAVLDELITHMIEENWVKPLKQYDDPVEGIRHTIIEVSKKPEYDIIKHGCPLNNLAQEMSSLDEEFRIRINHLFEHWINTFANKLKQGQDNGTVKPDIDATSAATFLVASLEGCISIIKASRDQVTIQRCLNGVNTFLDTLKV